MSGGTCFGVKNVKARTPSHNCRTKSDNPYFASKTRTCVVERHSRHARKTPMPQRNAVYLTLDRAKQGETPTYYRTHVRNAVFGECSKRQRKALLRAGGRRGKQQQHNKDNKNNSSTTKTTTTTTKHIKPLVAGRSRLPLPAAPESWPLPPRPRHRRSCKGACQPPPSRQQTNKKRNSIVRHSPARTFCTRQ